MRLERISISPVASFGFAMSAGARFDDALDLDDVLAARGLRKVPRLRGVARIENHLREAVAVAQVDENNAAVVADGLHPAAQAERVFPRVPFATLRKYVSAS